MIGRVYQLLHRRVMVLRRTASRVGVFEVMLRGGRETPAVHPSLRREMREQRHGVEWMSLRAFEAIDR